MKVKTNIPYEAYPYSEEATELSRTWAKASYPSFLILAGIGIVIYDVPGALIAIVVWFIIRAWTKKTIKKIAAEDSKAYLAKQLELMISAAQVQEELLRKHKARQQKELLHAQRMKNLRVELMQNKDKNTLFSTFLNNAEACHHVAEVSALWETMHLNEDDSFAGVTAIINKNAEIERLYGVSESRVATLITEIKENLNLVL